MTPFPSVALEVLLNRTTFSVSQARAFSGPNLRVTALAPPWSALGVLPLQSVGSLSIVPVGALSAPFCCPTVTSTLS